jgi:hypothetical protein
VGLYQQTPYNFWQHTNNATGKELIFLNTTSNNFLETTIKQTNKLYGRFCNGRNKNDKWNAKHSFIFYNSNKASDIIPIINFCTVMKLINNTESKAVDIKSLAELCDLISIDEGSYRFFADLYGISCEFTGEGNYVICSDKDLEEIKFKDQGFNNAVEKIVNITSDNSKNGLNLD